METVSESFKKAIKSNTREVKGYVEIIYKEIEQKDYTMTLSPTKAIFSLNNEIVDGNKKIKNYASLEEDYTLLDGSFILPNYNIKGDNAGYISNEIFNNIERPILKIVNEAGTSSSSGITIYFKNNIAQKFSITIIKSDDTSLEINVIDNQKEIYQYIFEEEISIKSLQLDLIQMEYDKRRIRIPEIDLGISQIYEGNDLVSFSTTEEIDLLLTSTPINDCQVNLNNYDNSFDPINPVGLAKYLTEDCIIKPYIGILTEENGIEYIKMGYFYLNDWSSDTDGNVTLNGKNLIAILSKTDLKSNGDLLRNDMSNYNYLTNYLNNCYNYKFNIELPYVYNMLYLNFYNLLDVLKYICSYMLRKNNKRKFFISRENIITFNKLNQEVVENISRNELLEDAKFENKVPIKKVTIIGNNNNNYTDGESGKEIINAKYVLSKPVEYVWYVHNESTENSKGYDYVYTGDSFSFSYSCNNSNAKAEIIDMNCYMVYVKLSGEIGDEFSIILKDWVAKNSLRESKNIFNSKQEVGDELEIDFKNTNKFSNSYTSSMADYYFDNDKKYLISANYIGDPSLMPGDMVSIETKYGYKDVIITKQILKFDGGLSGTIEGVGD
ncbi:MAG: hypothetical protein ACI31R_05365 [Bacilli bacterium]